MIATTILVVLVSAFVTDIIGIHAIFGGFLVGLIIPHDSGFAEGLTRRLEDLIGVIFLPIYFALSGLKTQIGLLDNAEAWGLVVLVTMVACTGKIVGCSVAALVNGMTWRESLAIGFLMNCKGLVELIVLNIGYDAGVINNKVFVIMVAMCIITTMMATPFVRLIFPVAYQREIEAQRARQLQEKEYEDHMNDAASFLEDERATHMHPDIQQQKRGVVSTASTLDSSRPGKNNDHRRLPHIDLADLVSRTTTKDGSQRLGSGGIMLCLDKTANAPSVMALLQLFTGSAAPINSSYTTSFQQPMPLHQRTRSNQQTADSYSTPSLQPPLDPFDRGHGNPGTQSQTRRKGLYTLRSGTLQSTPIFALRMLNISERTTSVMLTASRCLDRLYKDTVMMMVMAFSKLNSIAVQPLVTLSTNVTSSDVVDDILDQAVEHNVACIIFPWNSSHLTDLGSPDYQSGSSTNLPTNVPISVQPTSTSTAESHSQPPLRHRVYTNASEVSVAEYGFHRGPRHLHEFFHFPQLFDHDEAHRVTEGRHTHLSESGRHHRTSVTSNTKVLSKLLQTSPRHQIAIGALVDRGLGLVGGIRHIVVPLFGGQDDEEALLLAASFASNPRAKCFVTIARVAGQLPLHSVHRHASMTESTHRLRQPSQDLQAPVLRSATAADLPARGSGDALDGAASGMMGGHLHPGDDCLSGGMRVPKDDEGLLRAFFPTKPRFRGSRHLSHVPSMSQKDDNDADPSDAQEDGVIVLHFQTMVDMTSWAKNSLTVRDLMVVGSDTPTHLPESWCSTGMEGRMTGGVKNSESFGSNIADIWNNYDGCPIRFSVDAPTPMYSPPLGSSASIYERQAAAATLNHTRHISAPWETTRPLGGDNDSKGQSLHSSHNCLPTSSAQAGATEDPLQPSLAQSPPRISLTVASDPAMHTNSPSHSRTQSYTSLSSASYRRPSMQSQRTTQQHHLGHNPRSPVTPPLPPRRNLSGKGMSIKVGKPAFSRSPTPTVPPTLPPSVDSERQLVLGPAVEYFIQSHVQVSYLVVRSPHAPSKSDRPSMTPKMSQRGASMVPLGARNGTAVSIGAGVGTDTEAADATSLSRQASLHHPRPATEVPSTPPMVEADLRGHDHAPQRQDLSGQLSQATEQSTLNGDDYLQPPSPVKNSNV
ncbi:K(+)/H(+) antiporter [Actinomortierella ambigua]|nr:K(+)/H(+) antiporter [Actinomortierella ambigua]